MSYVRILIHLVFCTKNREPLISDELLPGLLAHIKENARNKGTIVYELNGDKNHIHLLISLKTEQPVSQLAHLLKGESSFWINQNHLTKTKFHWTDEYFAVSIGESQKESLIRYIRGQKEHHRVKSFKEEYDEFIRKYNFNLRG